MNPRTERTNRLVQCSFYVVAGIAVSLVAINLSYILKEQWGKAHWTHSIDTPLQLFMFEILPVISEYVALLACALGLYVGFRVSRSSKQQALLFLSMLALVISDLSIPRVIN